MKRGLVRVPQSRQRPDAPTQVTGMLESTYNGYITDDPENGRWIGDLVLYRKSGPKWYWNFTDLPNADLGQAIHSDRIWDEVEQLTAENLGIQGVHRGLLNWITYGKDQADELNRTISEFIEAHRNDRNEFKAEAVARLTDVLGFTDSLGRINPQAKAAQLAGKLGPGRQIVTRINELMHNIDPTNLSKAYFAGLQGIRYNNAVTACTAFSAQYLEAGMDREAVHWFFHLARDIVLKPGLLTVRAFSKQVHLRGSWGPASPEQVRQTLDGFTWNKLAHGLTYPVSKVASARRLSDLPEMDITSIRLEIERLRDLLGLLSHGMAEPYSSYFSRLFLDAQEVLWQLTRKDWKRARQEARMFEDTLRYRAHTAQPSYPLWYGGGTTAAA